ncbi:MAG: hypothetical protein LC792_01050, partial [Actinobacteria bacterium]|nr:hypothetical protein [Actinomycetota bacterium]
PEPATGAAPAGRRSPLALAVWVLVGGPVALASLPVVLDRSFRPYKGTGISDLGGDLAFPISVVLAVLGLWVVVRGLTTGRDRWLAASLLAVSGVFDVRPATLAVAAALEVLLLRRSAADGERPSIRYLLGAVWPALLLVALWALPSPLGLVGPAGAASYRAGLFPPELRWWLLPLSAGGAVLALLYGRRPGVILVVVTAALWLTVRLAPEGAQLNGRFLPFWYLCLLALAGLAVAEFAAAAGRLAPEPLARARLAGLATPLAAALAVWLLVGLPLGALPAPLATWLSTASTRDSNFVPSWATWNYSGYERKPAWAEYKGIMTTMARVGREHGCGRAHWEYDENINRFGTPLALMLLPYWTSGCIASMEGLYFESSATTPYHFLSAAELSKAPSDPQRDLPYRSLDVPAGVRHLQLLGTRYYMAFSPPAVAQAEADPDLRLIDQTGSWKVFEVSGSELVTPLRNQPAVLTGVGRGARPWLDASVNWYQDPSRWDVPLAAGGPREWARVAVHRSRAKKKAVGDGVTVDPPPLRPVVPAQVTGIRAGDDSLSFDVDRPGSPVLVKVSYFPNWRASGANGPWRVTPNLMVVVPTARHVALHYGTTPVDGAGWVLSLAGLASAVVLARRRPLDYSPRPPAPAAPGDGARAEDGRQPVTVAAGHGPDS